MLYDLIATFSSGCQDNLEKILYVPSQYILEAGQLLAELTSNETWRIIPMSTNDESLRASYLSDILANCLR
jgi:hypothetical protein